MTGYSHTITDFKDIKVFMFEISSQTSKKYMMSSQILLGTTSDKYFQIIFRSIMKTEN